MLSFLPVSPPFDGLCHCMKQLCPEVRLSMDTCFNGDSSHAQVHPRSPSYPPAGTAALPTPQPACLRALSKSTHCWAGARTISASHHPCGSSSTASVQASGAEDLPMPLAVPHHPPTKGRGWRPPCSHLLPEPSASTEIPDSKAFLGIQQLLSTIIIISPAHRGSLPPPAGPPWPQGNTCRGHSPLSPGAP